MTTFCGPALGTEIREVKDNKMNTVILNSIFFGIMGGAMVFVYDSLKRKIATQQTLIDDLKRELEEMKGKNGEMKSEPDASARDERGYNANR